MGSHKWFHNHHTPHPHTPHHQHFQGGGWGAISHTLHRKEWVQGGGALRGEAVNPWDHPQYWGLWYCRFPAPPSMPLQPRCKE